MKLNFSILPFAIVTTAFVLPNIEVMEQIAVEKRLPSHLNRVKDPTGAVLSGLNTQTAITVQKPLRFAISSVTKETKAKIKCHQSAALFDVQADFASSVKVDENIDIEKSINLLPSPHKKQMGDETLPTVYQLLSTSKKTQKFAKLINDFPDLVELLNGTAANYTVFAPIDEGVHDAPEDDKPSKELLHKVLTYHISPIPYNAYSVFFARTIRTLQKEEELGDYPQRLRVGFGLGGLQLNFQSKLLSTDNACPSFLPFMQLTHPVRLKWHPTYHRRTRSTSTTRSRTHLLLTIPVLNLRARAAENGVGESFAGSSYRRHSVRAQQCCVHEARADG